MKRVLLICLSLVLALGGWSVVCAEDGFYVISGGAKRNYAPVPKTGQTNPYGLMGTDGDLKKGVAWPTPRFTDNNNGTVTDNLTKLIWMKNASNDGAVGFGYKTWDDALSAAATVAHGIGGVEDGSKAGDWRLPNRKELESLVDCAFSMPALPDTLGTVKWVEGNPFQGVQSREYWSSSTYARDTTAAWYVHFGDGTVNAYEKSQGTNVWCVRAGP